MTAVIFVDNGTELMSDVMLAFTGASVTASGWYIGWGTGGSGTLSTATNTDVDLEAPATEARVSATAETQSAGDTNQWVGRLQTTTSKTIEEAGLYTDATGTATDMWIRGNELSPMLQGQVLNQFVHRMTVENEFRHPAMAKRAKVNGYRMPRQTDREWLAVYMFDITVHGKLSQRTKHCEPWRLDLLD